VCLSQIQLAPLHFGGETGVQRIFSGTLREFNYSASGAKLIASAPGVPHRGDDIALWGQGAVREFLGRQTFPACFRGAPIICQYSSTGSTTEKWLDQMQKTFSCGGTAAAAEEAAEGGGGAGGQPGGSGGGGGGGGKQRSSSQVLLGPGNLELIWPTVEAVGRLDE
jgi:tyrosyl-DNA phosphodiesterase-1